jgi:effector-binding domain-containing protein
MNLLYTRKMMSMNDCIAGFGMYFDRMYQRIAAEKLTLIGRPMTFHHNPEFDPAGIDTEFALPIKETVKGTRNLHGGLCVKSALDGSYFGLRSVYVRLSEWVENEGYKLADSAYEIYVVDPTDVAFPDDLVTEVYFPIKKK